MFWCLKSSTQFLENRPTLENKPAPFMNEFVVQDAFLLSTPPIYAIVHAVMLSKKHWRSYTAQEEGLKNEGRHHLLLLLEQKHDKESIAEVSYVNRAKPSACEVGVFSREISQLSKICPPPSMRSSLSYCPWAYFQEITVTKFWVKVWCLLLQLIAL